MKKLMLIALLPLLFISCQRKATDTKTVSPNLASVATFNLPDILIEYGENKQIDGQYFPCFTTTCICTITVVTTQTDPLVGDLGPSQDYGYLENDGGSLVVYMWKPGIRGDLLDNFSEGEFHMTQARTIPLAVASHVGFTADYEIAAGDYDYTEDENYYRIVF